MAEFFVLSETTFTEWTTLSRDKEQVIEHHKIFADI